MKQVQIGLKENWKQFTVFVIINAYVGGMIGLERSIFPRIAEVVAFLTGWIASEYGLSG